MATWTQPATFYRDADTSLDYGDRDESFVVRFKAKGRCELLPDGTRRFVHGDTATATALPAIGDVPAIKTLDDTLRTYTNYRIARVAVSSYDNSESVITLTISPLTIGVTYTSPAQVDELEWVPHSDPPEAAPRYRTHLLTTTTFESATVSQGQLFKWWKDQSDTDRAKTIYDAMSSGTKELADRYTQGLREYRYWIPVARRTDRASSYASGSAGAFESPPMSAPGGYTYQKTAARSIRQGEAGTWEAVGEWSGYKSAFTDLDTPL